MKAIQKQPQELIKSCLKLLDPVDRTIEVYIKMNDLCTVMSLLPFIPCDCVFESSVKGKYNEDELQIDNIPCSVSSI